MPKQRVPETIVKSQVTNVYRTNTYLVIDESLPEFDDSDQMTFDFATDSGNYSGIASGSASGPRMTDRPRPT